MSFEKAAEAMSFRRSSDRARVMIKLRKHRVMYPNELAIACRMHPSRLRDVIFGRPPYYRVERSPFALGWVVVVRTADGDVYAITPKGMEETEELARRGPMDRGWRE